LTVAVWAAPFIAAAVALTAWRLRALTPGGAVAATGVGTAILIGAGWWGGAVLLTFFLGSTIVSRLCPDPAVEQGEAKGGRRDAGQVLANGGIPALGALAGGVWPLAAGLAAAAADTWATSLGATSPAPPRHIFTGRQVPAGTSGGVTWRGSLGGVAGAATVAGVTVLATGSRELGTWAVVIGTSGMLLDSMLGAVLQGRFHCPACDVATERRRHRCGTESTRIGGIGWVTNDVVNALATGAATFGGWWLGAHWR
jgi:uncharacterized protein (TIGR00297 family)